MVKSIGSDDTVFGPLPLHSGPPKGIKRSESRNKPMIHRASFEAFPPSKQEKEWLTTLKPFDHWY